MKKIEVSDVEKDEVLHIVSVEDHEKAVKQINELAEQRQGSLTNAQKALNIAFDMVMQGMTVVIEVAPGITLQWRLIDVDEQDNKVTH